HHLRAAQILERYGFRGIFFVIPNRMVHGHPQHLTPAEVRQMVAGGHRVAAHGFEHRSLASSVSEVAGTVARSREIIAARADARAAGADFAFPFGHYTPEVAEAVAGRFRYLHTVDPGYWDGRSALVPRLLLMNDVDPALFQAYVLGGAGNLPAWEPLFASGGMGDSIAFLARGGSVPAEVELFAISPDAEGRSYASHPLGEAMRVRGDTVWVHVGEHLRRYFPPERIAVSYALVTRADGRIRYLTPGLLHWVRDPSLPPAP
ncbi:MAG TPA: polysaccharide deacetylase family protein, partial [Longimicrobium sp.]|nr:polysaccharide deacetylase family protein [Longimicrobium sp.]